MRARCRFCKRVMTAATFAAHAKVTILKFLTAPLQAIYSKALEFYLSMQFKGILDDEMAVFANEYFNIHCPKCKKEDCWDPYPEKEPTQASMKAKKKTESERMV